MKIAYFTEWSPYAPSGVLRKILGQVAAWKEKGHAVSLYSLAPPQPGPVALGYEAHGEVLGTIPQRRWSATHGHVLGFVNKLVSAPQIARRLQVERPDLIYYRPQGPWYPGLRSILKVAPSVMELNANFEDAEQWGGLLKWYARATRNAALSAADGFVCVSDEIRDELSGFGKPVRTIPNSMWGARKLFRRAAIERRPSSLSALR